MINYSSPKSCLFPVSESQRRCWRLLAHLGLRELQELGVTRSPDPNSRSQGTEGCRKIGIRELGGEAVGKAAGEQREAAPAAVVPRDLGRDLLPSPTPQKHDEKAKREI